MRGGVLLLTSPEKSSSCIWQMPLLSYSLYGNDQGFEPFDDTPAWYAVGHIISLALALHSPVFFSYSTGFHWTWSPRRMWVLPCVLDWGLEVLGEHQRFIKGSVILDIQVKQTVSI